MFVIDVLRRSEILSTKCENYEISAAEKFPYFPLFATTVNSFEDHSFQVPSPKRHRLPTLEPIATGPG